VISCEGVVTIWCDLGKLIITVALVCLVTVSGGISNIAFAVGQLNYKPQEFRAVLHGLGCTVKLTNNTPILYLVMRKLKKQSVNFKKVIS
jgi:ABC-type amino acid transport system permease subunit